MDDTKRLLERAQHLAPTPAFDLDDVRARKSRHERRRRVSAAVVGLSITAAIVAGAVDNGVASFNRVRYRHHDESIFLYAFDPDRTERRRSAA